MEIYQLDVKPPKPTENWVTGVATIVLAYYCHVVFFYLRGEMRSKTTKRVRKIIKTAVTVETLLYLVISIAGYASLGATLTPDIFLLRKPLRKPPNSTNYYFELKLAKNSSKSLSEPIF
jgi:amino acid permease